MAHARFALIVGWALLALVPGCGTSDVFTPFEASDGAPSDAGGPAILAVVPSRGSVLGGESVQIQGRGFDATRITALTLGGVALADVVVESATSIRARTPPAAPGSASLLLEQEGAVLRLTAAYHYEAPPSLYVADGRGGEAGSLHRVTLAGPSIETIGTLPFALTGLAQGPTGALWGVEATRRGRLGDSRLVWIDPVPDPLTGALTTRVVGVLRDVNRDLVHQAISDITFVGARLIGWTQDGDVPCEIDPATARVTPLGAMLVTYGGGLAFDGDRTIWLAPQGTDGALHAYDLETDSTVTGPPLAGASIEGSAIGAMARVGSVLFAVELSGHGLPERRAALVSIDPLTGLLTPLLALPPGAAAIARGDA